MWWWRSGWDGRSQALTSAEIQHGPGCGAHWTAGKAAGSDFKGHPAWMVNAVEKSHHINGLVSCILNCQMSSPFGLQLGAQQLWLIGHLMASDTTNG